MGVTAHEIGHLLGAGEVSLYLNRTSHENLITCLIRGKPRLDNAFSILHLACQAFKFLERLRMFLAPSLNFVLFHCQFCLNIKILQKKICLGHLWGEIRLFYLVRDKGESSLAYSETKGNRVQLSLRLRDINFRLVSD